MIRSNSHRCFENNLQMIGGVMYFGAIFAE
jgi:hypothetical protein